MVVVPVAHFCCWHWRPTHPPSPSVLVPVPPSPPKRSPPPLPEPPLPPPELLLPPSSPKRFVCLLDPQAGARRNKRPHVVRSALVGRDRRLICKASCPSPACA